MPFILNLLNSSNVVVVLSQLLLVAQAVVPITQLLVSGSIKSDKMRTAPSTSWKSKSRCYNKAECKMTPQATFVIDTLNY